MIKKCKIESKIYDLASYDEYAEHPENFQSGYSAILEGDTIYPVRGKTDTRPGLYNCGPAVQFVPPGTEDAETYSSENIIDFDNVKSLQDVMAKQDALRGAERTILTTIDNLFITEINQDDSPEMKGLKEAINLKQIDIDKYAQRFGDNFNNDKRLLRKDSITMSKMKSMMNILDMKGTLIIEDKSDDVPNPIGKRIVVEITNGEDKDNDDTEGNDI